MDVLHPVLRSVNWSNKGVVTLAVVSAYLGLVRVLRWRRYNELHKRFAGRRPDSLSVSECQQVIHLSAEWDMPLLINYSLSFALFKTYAIPTISGLLRKTGELSSGDMVGRRYADTEILISTWLLCPIMGTFNPAVNEKEQLDPRANIAIARTNWIHSHYNISNEDFLYTMCLFVLEPKKWTARYGWRELSELEQQAYYLAWVEAGNRLGIHSIPDSLEKLSEWSDRYEREYMVPAESSRDVAQYTIDELLHPIPNVPGLKAFLQRLIICLLEERVRIAMLQPAQPWYIHAITRSAAYSFMLVQRYLCLPRWKKNNVVDYDAPPKGECPRLHPTRWQSKPWYKPEPKGVSALLESFKVAVGLADPESLAGPKYKSEGFRLEEMGPPKWEGQGLEEVLRQAAQLQGCPITGPWGRKDVKTELPN